jgi:pilus assembly protein Flp/PilA
MFFAKFFTKRRLVRFLVDDDGPTAVEYAVLLALIIVSCLAAVGTLASGTAASYDHSASQLAGVLGP